MIESDQFCSEMSIRNISKISNDFLNSKWIFVRRGNWFKRIRSRIFLLFYLINPEYYLKYVEFDPMSINFDLKVIIIWFLSYPTHFVLQTKNGRISILQIKDNIKKIKFASLPENQLSFHITMHKQRNYNKFLDQKLN